MGTYMPMPSFAGLTSPISGSATTGAGWPLSGTAMICGYPATAQYDPAADYIDVAYLSALFRFTGASLQNDPNLIFATLINHYQSNYSTGAQNVSGQSHQALSGNSYQSQLGGGLVNAPAAQQNNAIGQQHLHQLYGGSGPGAAYYAAAQQAAAQQSAQQFAYYHPIYPQQAVEPPAKPLKTDSIKIGELTGWRGWNIDSNGFPRSMTADVLWAPNEPMEGKTKSKEEHNGIYTYKHARTFLKNHSLDVYGKCHIWGDIIEHELGYRSEWAKIISLDGVTDKKRHNLQDLRERYGALQ